MRQFHSFATPPPHHHSDRLLACGSVAALSLAVGCAAHFTVCPIFLVRACAFYAKRTDVLVDNKFTHITVACFVKGQSVCDVYFVCTGIMRMLLKCIIIISTPHIDIFYVDSISELHVTLYGIQF